MPGKIQNVPKRKTRRPAALPRGVKPAPPIRNAKLRALLSGPDITVSGGLNTLMHGEPVMRKRAKAITP